VGSRVERIDRRGSIVFVDFSVQPPPGLDPTLALRNTTNVRADARCFYVSSDANCSGSPQFSVEVPLQSELSWKAAAGIPSTIPPVPTVPFTGSLVCVQTDIDGVPSAANALIASYSDEEHWTCARDGQSIAAHSFLPPNLELRLDGVDYDYCPPSREAEIGGCWSQLSTFTFTCQ
jgi:hypothetical protein